MDLQCLELGPIATNAYLLAAPERGEAVVVDAPDGVARFIADWSLRSGCRLSTVLLTHGHWDHTQDLAALRATGAEVWAHRGDREWIENPGVMAPYAMPGMTFEPAAVDRWLEDDEQLEVLGQQVEVRHVPGHAPGSILFYFAEPGWAFSGDALFAGGVGRYDLPGGDWLQLEKAIRERIYTLPDSTRVFPGHGPETTVVEERHSNPFVTLDR